MEEDSVKLCSSSNSGPATSLRHVSLLNSGITTKESFKTYCTPACKFRKLKNKGAFMALMWIYLIESTFYYLQNSGSMLFNLQLVVLGLTLSLAGWLADVWLGRYKAICFSMWITWIAVMLITTSSVVSQFEEHYSNISSYIQVVLTIIANIGIGGFLANIVQFGLDQLHDSSTNEITSFIIWLVWTYCITGYIAYFAVFCVPKAFLLLGNLVVCVYLSTTLSSTFIFNHLLVKEPSSQNPFKLIYNVVKYAIKNKHPTFRSAFTYCEDYLPSRIDFGKSKYGGPFTTEQVEDVKTFFRILVIIAIGSVSFGGHLETKLLLIKVHNILRGEDGHCDYKEIFMQSMISSVAIVIPLYELIFYPLFSQCLAFIDSHKTVIIGFLLLVATIVTLMVLDTAARNNLENSNITNKDNHTVIVHTLDYRWIAIPCIFKSMSVALFGIGGMVFIASQSPYSMRGIITGTAYASVALSAALGRVISIPFTKRLSIWGTGVISSGFWHMLLLLIIEIVAGTMLIATLRWYKNRKREDVLPNEHIFAERYYGGTENDT